MQAIAHILNDMEMTNRDLFDIVFSICLAIAISFIVSQIYKFTHRGLNYELSFMKTLVLLAPIVSSVMLFIRGDLVLSLGLIGSLSIIRFRTPIKDTRDMVFLFWVIAIGLGCGTYNWLIVIITSIIITVTIFILHIVKYGSLRCKDFVLVISGTSSLIIKEISSAVAKYAQDIRIRSQEIEDDRWEIVYELRFDHHDKDALDSVVIDLQKMSNVNKVSLLAPQIALPA